MNNIIEKLESISQVNDQILDKIFNDPMIIEKNKDEIIWQIIRDKNIKQHSTIIEYLIKHGANPEPDYDILAYAVQYNMDDVVDALLAHGVPTNYIYLDSAIRNHNIKMFKKLFDTNPNIQNIDSSHRMIAGSSYLEKCYHNRQKEKILREYKEREFEELCRHHKAIEEFRCVTNDVSTNNSQN